LPKGFKGALRGFFCGGCMVIDPKGLQGLKTGKEKPPEGGLVSGC